MGTRSSSIKITNNTKSPMKVQVTDCNPGDWDGDTGNPEFVFKELPVRILPDKNKTRHVELYKPAANCPFKMILTFDDGSKDTFKVNQKWATEEAPLDLRKTMFDHLVQFDRSEYTMSIDVVNTTLQNLAYQLRKDLETYKNECKAEKYVDALSHAETLLLNQNKIRAEKRPDKLAKKIIADLWNPTHVLLAKIKLGLATNYKKSSVEMETKGERAESWRYFQRSKDFLLDAIVFSKEGKDNELTSKLEGKIPIYDEKMKCNELFNLALNELEEVWKKMFKYNESKNIFNDPVYQTSGYITKYERIRDACESSDVAVQEFTKVKDAFDALIKKDEDYKKCVEPVEKIIKRLTNFYPTLRKTQLQVALQPLTIVKSDQQEFLWKGEELVEIKAPEEPNYL